MFGPKPSRRIVRQPQPLFKYHPAVMQLEERSAPGDAVIGGVLMGATLGLDFLVSESTLPRRSIGVVAHLMNENDAAIESGKVTAPATTVRGNQTPVPTVLQTPNNHPLFKPAPRGGDGRAGPFDLAVTQINTIQKVATVGGTVGLTFGTVSMNVGTEPLPWLFSVRESATTPWVVQNGFSWFHGHTQLLDPPIPAPNTKYDIHYGQHPHMQLFLFSQPPGNTGLNNLKLMGKSDLKHGFKTDDGGEEHGHHFLHPGNTDPYSSTLNKNRSFYGPVSEIDPVTFKVAAHDHFGFVNGDGHYERNHGDKPNVPGDTEAPPNHANAIEHLLQVPAASIDPTKIRPGTKLFAAASYFVVDDSNLVNNALYREVNPTTFAFVGSNLPGRFIWPT